MGGTELRSWTLTRRSEENGGPDDVGCAVAFVFLMFLGVVFLIVLYVLWEKATSGS